MNILNKICQRLSPLKFIKVDNDFLLKEDNIQNRGKQISQSVFTGGPLSSFSKVGRLQLITLLKNGLVPTSKLLDVGCGALRGGYWAIHFLDKNRYFGIEPNKKMLDDGLNNLLEPELLKLKAPEFDFNADFDFSVFNQKFDFVIARSIWTHASKGQISKMLEQFKANTTKRGVFLVSYLKPSSKRKEYFGEDWIGKSHESENSGLAYHSYKWIKEECEKFSLSVQELNYDVFNNQVWLRIENH